MRSTGKLPPPTGSEVDALLETSEHPLRDDIVRVRQLILEASGRVSEAVRWNAPAFLIGRQIFGFVDLSEHESIHLVLHPARNRVAEPLEIPGRAAALVSWRRDDEAVVVIDPSRLKAHRTALTALIRAWVGQFS